MLASRSRLLFTILAIAIAIGLPTSVGATQAVGTQNAQFTDGWYKLRYVIDGDTIRVQGLERDVRLAGIDAAESYEPYGPRATATLKWLLTQGQYPGWVYLEVATPSYDNYYGRYRAHVWFSAPNWGNGWVLTQGYLALTGLATVDSGYYASDLYYDYLAWMESYAQSRNCGIWGGQSC